MIYGGPPVRGRFIALTPVAQDEIDRVRADSTVRPSLAWHHRSLSDDSCLYLGIREASRLVGQIFLHDIDRGRAEALVGYHVFATADRGKGIGTEALTLIVGHPELAPGISSLVVITSADNIASQRVAERSGFKPDGHPREDPDGLRYRYRRFPRR